MFILQIDFGRCNILQLGIATQVFKVLVGIQVRWRGDTLWVTMSVGLVAVLGNDGSLLFTSQPQTHGRPGPLALRLRLCLHEP